MPGYTKRRMLRARLIGSGAAIPETRVANAEIEARIGLPAGWIFERSGIETRPVLRPPETLLDLVEHAARGALDAAGVRPRDLDGIMVGTTTAEHVIPTIACQLQSRLDAAPGFAFDLAAACSGFLYGLGLSNGLLATGAARTVLVVGADVMSTVCERTDRIVAPIFGDGAGAAVLRADEGDAGLLRVLMRARGSEIVVLPAGGPFDVGDGPRPAERCLRMQGAELFRTAVTELLRVTRDLLAQCDLAIEDVALLVPHQANRRMLDAMADHLGIARDRVFCHIDRYGNLSGGSLPVALDAAWRTGRLGAGDLAVLNAVGGGLTWGAAALRL